MPRKKAVKVYGAPVLQLLFRVYPEERADGRHMERRRSVSYTGLKYEEAVRLASWHREYYPGGALQSSSIKRYFWWEDPQ